MAIMKRHEKQPLFFNAVSKIIYLNLLNSSLLQDNSEIFLSITFGNCSGVGMTVRFLGKPIENLF